MTDLTTMHLKCLLEKANEIPLPTTYTYKGGAPSGIYEEHRDKDSLRETMNLSPLAQAAPALAQEVIRLREELIDWANDEARAHNALVKRAQEAGGAGIVSTHKTIYNRIWEILGDTND